MKLNQALSAIHGPRERAAHRKLADASLRPLSYALLSSGGLAIKAGGSAVVKTAAAVFALASGTLMTKAAGDMAALAGTVSNAAFNVYVFSMDSAGTLTTAMGTEGAAIGNVKFPPTPADSVVLGFLLINPTGTGDFVGGTTALDDGTVVPTAVYVNTPFPVNFSVEV